MSEEFLSAFSAATSDTKLRAFEVTTIKRLLMQLGASATLAKFRQRELGEEFTFDWFNSQRLIPPFVSTVRCNYAFEELFTTPAKSPLLPLFKTAEEVTKDQTEEGTPTCMIFNCFKVGRLIATNIQIPEFTHLHVRVRTTRFNIVPFKGFFLERYGHVLQE